MNVRTKYGFSNKDLQMSTQKRLKVTDGLTVPVVQLSKASPSEMGAIVFDRSTKRMYVADGAVWTAISSSRDIDSDIDSNSQVDDRAVKYYGPNVSAQQTYNKIVVTETLAIPAISRAVVTTTNPGAIFYDPSSSNVLVAGQNGSVSPSVSIVATNSTIVVDNTNPAAPTIGGGYVGSTGVNITGNVISGNYMAGPGVSVVGDTISNIAPSIFVLGCGNGAVDYFSFNSVATTVVSSFPYMATTPIKSFALALSNGSGTPTGTVYIYNPATSFTIASITFDGISSSTPVLYSSSSISNLPLTASILQVIVNQTAAVSAINLHSILIN